jgi:hypothetical protein
VESILDAIGNTPLVRLRRCAPANGAELWLKLEYTNPTGSMKDRMAQAMIEGAERDGLISPGDTIVEYTGGSTGPALALVCRAKGYRALIVIGRLLHRGALPADAGARRRARRDPVGRRPAEGDRSGHRQHGRARRRARRPARALRHGSVPQPVHRPRPPRASRPRDPAS